MVGGWFIGDFVPSIIRTDQFEVCFKEYQAGDSEPAHFQRTAKELTLVTDGQVQIGQALLQKGQLILIEPGEIAGFFAITKASLVAVKWPSLPNDKELA